MDAFSDIFKHLITRFSSMIPNFGKYFRVKVINNVFLLAKLNVAYTDQLLIRELNIRTAPLKNMVMQTVVLIS